MELTTATATTSSGSSRSSTPSSSSSSLNLFMLEDESNMNNRSAVAPDHTRTPTKQYCQQHEERFFFVGESDEGEHHFLEWCFLCQKPISSNHEIFMYRGDEAFCSEKCRIQQMEMDEALETIKRRQRLKTKSSRWKLGFMRCFVGRRGIATAEIIYEAAKLLPSGFFAKHVTVPARYSGEDTSRRHGLNKRQLLLHCRILFLSDRITKNN